MVKVDNILVHMYASYRKNNIIFVISDKDYLFPPISSKIHRNLYSMPNPGGGEVNYFIAFLIEFFGQLHELFCAACMNPPRQERLQYFSKGCKIAIFCFSPKRGCKIAKNGRAKLSWLYSTLRVQTKFYASNLNNFLKQFLK